MTRLSRTGIARPLRKPRTAVSDGDGPVDPAALLVGTALRDRLEPTPTVDRRAVEQPEEQLLQALRDRTALAFADADLVDGAHGRNLGRGAGQEHLVGDVQELA